MPQAAKSLAIIIPTINRKHDLERLLDSILRQRILPKQVIIVDGTAVSQQDIAQRYANLHITYVHAPSSSVAAARNMGIKKVQPRVDLVSILDDDIVLLDNALENMLSYWESAPPDVGGAVFNVVNFRDSTFFAYFKMLFCAWDREKGKVMRSGMNTMLFPASEDAYVQWIPSGIMMLRKEIFDEFHYDEWYKTCFCEDLDFGYRVGKKYKLRIVAGAKVEHLHGAAGRPNRIQFGKAQITDRYHFIGKDPGYFSRLLFHYSNIGCFLENAVKGIFGLDMDYIKTAYGNVLGVCEVFFGGGFPFRSLLFSALWAGYCAGCILWGNDFAKIHVNIPWFPAPLFIGELLLGSGILFAWPEIARSSPTTKRMMLFAAGVLFILTACGFLRYGPLALRHAAMFGYVFFAFLMYHFSARLPVVIFSGIVLYSVFLFVRFGVPGNEFYAFPVWALFCLAMNRVVRLLTSNKAGIFLATVILALAAFPLGMLFQTARTFIIANVISCLCVLLGMLAMVRVSRPAKLMALAAGMALLVTIVYMRADRNALRSMANFSEMRDRIVFFNRQYESLKTKFVPSEVSVSVYRPVEKEDAHVPSDDSLRGAATDAVREGSPLPPFEIAGVSEVAVSLSGTLSWSRTGGFVESVAAADIAAAPEVKTETITEPPLAAYPGVRSYETARQNILFRVFVWKGLFEELIEQRAFFGFGFGKPFRPRTTLVLGWTERLYLIDGWVSAHNSWFHLIYLFGIFGFLLGLCALGALVHMFWHAVKRKDSLGLLLCSALAGWIFGANTQPLLEQPHYVIFFWGLWGIAFRKVYS